MEALRNRPRAGEVGSYLDAIAPEAIAVTDFALHSIGVALRRHRALGEYAPFIADTVLAGGLAVLTIPTPDLGLVAETASALSLDFDDAYQYLVAERFDLVIVSLDAHFDRTPRGRKSPAEVTP